MVYLHSSTEMASLAEAVLSMRPYHGQSLGPNDIRLLSVNQTETGTLYLTTSPHQSTDAIEYDAISYVWGREDASVTIPCNNGFLQITPRAYEMLEHLRLYRPIPTRQLWIDAICINQADPVEKAVQISLMHRIYSKATSVVVWMGPATPDTLAFMVNFDSVKLIAREWIVIASLDLDPQERGVHLPLDSEDFWKGLYHLARNEWFRRLWTFQEVILAPLAVTMLCGSCYIDIDDFFRFIDDGVFNSPRYVPPDIPHPDTTLGAPAWRECANLRHIRRRFFEYHIQLVGMQDFPLLLHTQHDRKVEEKVDRIWAISAVLDQNIRRKLAPLVDYSEEGRANYWETYARVFRVIVEEGQRLDILSNPPSIATNDAIPSWCPDLSENFTCGLFFIGNWNKPCHILPDPLNLLSSTTENDTDACRTRHTTIQQHPEKAISFADDGQILCARGFVVDTVLKLVEDIALLGKCYYNGLGDFSWMQFDNPIHMAAIAFYRQGLDLARRILAGEDSSGDQIPGVFLMAILMDCRFNGLMGTAFQDALSIFTSCNVKDAESLKKSDLGSSRDRVSYSIAVLAALVGHSFFLTVSGRFGIATSGCKPGDKVCVFYGSEPLHILRRSAKTDHGSGDHAYAKFCGVAFIPHLMEMQQWEAARFREDETFRIA